MAAKRKRSNRAHGTGTIQRQPNGTFIARTADRRRSGRFPDRPSAEAALEQWNKALGLGRDPNEGRQSLRDFGRAWLVTVCKPKVQPSTLEFYTRHLGYATAVIGDLAVELLDTRDIERTLSRLRADGLSARSVNHVRAVLRNCLGVAVRWKLRADNPAAEAPEWRVDEDTGAPALTTAQVATLLAAVADDRLCALYHVALTLGLRRGELLALRWSDLDGDVLHVRETVKEGEGRAIVTGTTKSRQARAHLADWSSTPSSRGGDTPSGTDGCVRAAWLRSPSLDTAAARQGRRRGTASVYGTPPADHHRRAGRAAPADRPVGRVLVAGGAHARGWGVMGRAIIKIKDRYFEWSSVVDAPVTYGMTEDELRAWVRLHYGLVGERELPARLARVEMFGTSAPGYSLKDILAGNRAGPDEKPLTADQIYEMYAAPPE